MIKKLALLFYIMEAYQKYINMTVNKNRIWTKLL